MWTLENERKTSPRPSAAPPYGKERTGKNTDHSPVNAFDPITECGLAAMQSRHGKFRSPAFNNRHALDQPPHGETGRGGVMRYSVALLIDVAADTPHKAARDFLDTLKASHPDYPFDLSVVGDDDSETIVTPEQLARS